jgi:hypothetical protein
MITTELKKSAEQILKNGFKNIRAQLDIVGLASGEIAQSNGLIQQDADQVIDYLVKRGFIVGAANRFWLTFMGKLRNVKYL